MYLTRFTKTDGKTEDYFYNDLKDAADHLSLFANDDSGLYKNVAVLECETTTVVAVLTFFDGKPGEVITVGSKVQLKDEYSRPEERKYIYEVTNLNELTGRTNIACINSLMTIRPVETVGIEMIRLYQAP